MSRPAADAASADAPVRRAARAVRGVWLIVALVIAIAGASATWLHRELGQRAQAAAVRQAEAVARSAEAALNRSLLNIDLLLAGLAELPGLLTDPASAPQAVALPPDAQRAPQLLRALVDQRLLVRDLFLLDASGHVVAAAHEATSRLGPNLPAGFADRVRRHPTPVLAISEPAMHFGTGERVLYLARPLGPPAAPGLLAVASVPVAELTTMMAPSMPLPGLQIALENERGALLASVPPSDALLGRVLPPAPAELVGDGRARLRPSRLGEGLQFASTQATIYPWVTVTAGLSDASVAAAAQSERTTTVAIAAATVVLALAFGALAQVWLARLAAASASAVAARQALEEALASVDEGFLLWDADDRIVTWNQRYLALFPHLRDVVAPGVSLAQVARAASRRMMPDADEATREAWIADRVARRDADGLEHEQRLPDGRIVSAVERRTATGGMVSVYRDVTRERAAAQELERARRAAEAASEAKARFLATMSHEIRTPLNGVLGMNGLLLGTPLDPKQRLYVETIRSSGEALLAILNDVLDMSKLEAGRVALEPSPFDPSALVDEVAALLGARAAAKGIWLEVEHAAGAPARLEGDAGRIRQVLFNLMGNAVKFTERGGVTVRTLARPLGNGRTTWTVVVRDSGIGIAPQALPTLFDRFTQADNRISRQFGGSGLGLAITRELVVLMGGTIQVDSRLGEGSEFRVELPLRVLEAAPRDRPVDEAGAEDRAVAHAEDGAEVGAGGAPAGARALRVLVAEDNRINQLLLTAMLTQLGHFADVVGNGREAVQQVQAAPYDLVLMDIQMPEMDGISAARAIRALPGAAGRVPIVAVSAAVLPEQRASCRAAGMVDFVSKPVDLARLAQAITGAAAAAAV